MSGDNDEQKEFWEEFAALWVEHQDGLDTLFAPVLDGVLQRAELATEHCVLDIGCGTGASSVKAAEAVTAMGKVTGADISEPMLVRARARARHIGHLSFVTTDVATQPFEVGTFDRVISRFGTMFFSDPVAAFINIRAAMKPGARLSMACWGMLAANPWFQVPMYAAKARLGAPPRVDPDAPGPLAFRDVARVTDILRQAGFVGVTAEVDTLLLTPPGDVEAASRQAISLGPARRAITHFDATQDDLDAILGQVRDDMAKYSTAQGVRVPAQINFFSACAPG